VILFIDEIHNVLGAGKSEGESWPLQDILLLQELCVRINDTLCKHFLWLPPPCIAHTIAQFG